MNKNNTKKELLEYCIKYSRKNNAAFQQMFDQQYINCMKIVDECEKREKGKK